MVVRNGVTVEKWEDLKGKRIGIAPGSSTWFQFTGKMKDLDIPFDSFTSVNIQGAGSNFLIALKRGDIDVALTWEPFESEPIVEGYGYWPKLDYSDSVSVGGETGLIACTKAFIAANSDAVRLLLWAFLKSEGNLRNDKANSQRSSPDIPAPSRGVRPYRRQDQAWRRDHHAAVAGLRQDFL